MVYPLKKIKEFYSSGRNYYARVCSYMIEKFPFTDILYEHCEVADIEPQ